MTNGGLLTADQILSSSTPRTAYVEVPEWGGTVKVRGMTGKERASYRNSLVGRATQRLRAGEETGETELELVAFRSNEDVVAWCTIDEDGNRIFSDEQVERLGKADPAPIDKVAQKILQLSGMTREGAREIVGESSPEEQPATS